MRPYLLKGHARPINQVKYNREGDLLVSCAKDNTPSLWFAEDGTRLGTFNGHNGAIWTCDITWDSAKLLTGSADSSAKLWDMHTGETIFTFQYREPCRGVSFGVGDSIAAITSDSFMGVPVAARIVSIAEDSEEQTSEELLKISGTGAGSRWTRALFLDLNKTLLTSGDDGFVRKWDVETGKQIAEKELHEKQVNDVQLSADGTHFITASHDKSSKLIDTQTLEVLKTYQGSANINGASISPLHDHIVFGGGQDAQDVTMTSSRQGKFEARFFHKVYAEEFATVRGHFGPLNAVAYSPDGRGFTSGGEDGYVRLHHFDQSHFTDRYF